MIALRKYLVLIGLLTLLGFYWNARGNADPQSKTKSEANISSEKKDLPPQLGMASCSANGCHGGKIPEKPSETMWSCSFTHWLSYDKHAKAFEVLKSKRAIDMIENLRLSGDKWANAHEESRCLVCHTNPTLAEITRTGEDAKELVEKRKDGIGCEGCHGDALPWELSHTGWGKPKDLKPFYHESDMVWMNDLASRARVCAGCHLGAPKENGTPARDMNHDMIGAGHPRLNFELSLYQRLLPPHWTEKDRQSQNSPKDVKDAQVWFVGRAVQMEAGLKWLGHHLTGGTWPELSEFNCYGCHQGIPNKPRARESLGKWKWDPSWGFTNWIDLKDETEKKAYDAFMEVKQLIEKKPEDRPAIKKALSIAIPLWHDLGTSFAKKSFTETDFKNRLTILSANMDNPKKKPIFWDEAAQIYFGLEAYRRSWKMPDSLGKQLTEIGKKLRLPRTEGANFDSPRYFNNPRYTNEKTEETDDYTSAKAHKDLKDIISALLANK
jgi:hypothetical protein